MDLIPEEYAGIDSMDPRAVELQYCPVLFDIVSKGRVELADGQMIAVSGVSTMNNLRTIRQAVIQEKPTATLEVGLAFGASALAFLATSKGSGLNDYQHTAIDPFQRSMCNCAAISFIAEAGLMDNFQHIEQDSALALPRLCAEGRKFDIIYVDGSHIFEDVFIDFYYSTRLLNSRGLLLFDDCTDRHVRKVIRFIDGNFASILAREKILPPRKRDLKRRLGNAIGIQQLVAYRKVADTPRRWDAEFKSF